LVKSPKLAWPAALAGGGFLVLHALVHVSDCVAGREQRTNCWVSCRLFFFRSFWSFGWRGPRSAGRRSEAMLGWLVKKRIAAFEKEFDYDMEYARDMYSASPRAFWKFSKILALSEHREDASL